MQIIDKAKRNEEKRGQLRTEKKKSDAEALVFFEKCLNALQERLKTGMDNLSMFTFMFGLEGHPMSMERFPMFYEMFDVMPPKRELWMTGRQTAKTTSAVAANCQERMFRKNTNGLIVAPLFSQAKRISTEVAAPMLDDGLFRDEILRAGNSQTILQREYAGGSHDIYSYAYMDVVRIRGISGIDRLWVDEVQDIRQDILPIIEQTQVARPGTSWKRYTGTPLSTGNLIETLWSESSQGEQCIKCRHCNFWNVGSIDMHLLDMIGERTVICAKCGREFNEQDILSQVFVPRHRDREEMFRGRHISQVLHPLHALIPSQWRELRRSMNSSSVTDAQFYNEILGVSYDSADRMIDLEALKAASCLGPNTFKEAKMQRDSLAIRAMGVDWGGGGEGKSYTKIVFGGLDKKDGKIKVHYMLCLPLSMPPQQQISEVLTMIDNYEPDLFAHDYSGGGWLFEQLGLTNAIPARMLRPFTFGYSPTREVVYHKQADIGVRDSLHIDHTRSTFALFTLIKAGKVLFPDYEAQRDPATNERPMDDFQAVFAERKPSLRGGDVLTIKRDPGHSDDYVYATNLLATACWYEVGQYPHIDPTTFSLGENTKGARMQRTPEEVADMDGNWGAGDRVGNGRLLNNPDDMYVA